MITEDTSTPGSLAVALLSVFVLEHITAQELESYVKIFCQLLVTGATLWIILWKNKGDKKDGS
jgi:hypothetical protein